MSKLNIPMVVGLYFFVIVTHADPTSVSSDSFRHKAEIGIGIGGVIGSLIAGPPGSILGMAGGAWIAGNDENKDETISALKTKVIKSQIDLTIMENRSAELQRKYRKELQMVAAKNKISSLEELSHGISLAIYFRTNSAEIFNEDLERVQRLSEFLNQFPEVKLLVYGYADKRGNPEFNRKLGQKRAQAVRTALMQSGINNKRILTHSFGESKAKAIETDIDGIVFDRKVNITLTLNTQI